MNNLITEKSAQEMLTNYMPVFDSILTSSLNDFTKFLSSFTCPLTKRTKATFLNNIIVNYAKGSFTESEHIRIIERYESLSIIICDKLSIRFKKLNINLIPSNVKTKRNDKIINQQLIINFPNFIKPSDITCLDIGYVINDTYSNFDQKVIVCRQNRNILWEIKISSVSTENTTEVILFEAPENKRLKLKSDNKDVENSKL